MGLLTIDNLYHAFGDKDLYQGASLELYKGDHLGIVGQNGSGKSTLIRLMTGELSPNDGRIVWQKGISIGCMDQHAQVDENMSMADYLRTAFADLYEIERTLSGIYENMSERTDDAQLARAAKYQQRLEESGFYSIETEILRVAGGLGLDAIGLERKLGTLSGGQRAKVILAKLLMSAPDVLLLDEPTNFLDKEHISWLSGYLKSYRGAFAIVSHDFEFLDSITNCIADIEFYTITKYHGRYTDFVRQKRHIREEYARRYDLQRRTIEKLEEYIAKNKARASTARMAKSRQKQLDRMEVIAPPSHQAPPNIAFKGSALPNSRALTVENLSVGYTYPLLPGLNFDVRGGERTAITGFNGIGKSTLLKTLVGALPALGGEYSFTPVAKIGYFEQDLSWRDGDLTPLQLVSQVFPALTPKQARRELARCGVRAEHAQRPISTLSGGEQNKVKLCLLTANEYNFLILDEPTNHLDAESKSALGQAIADFPGCVLLVCHEAAFYRDLCERVIDIEKYLA